METVESFRAQQCPVKAEILRAMKPSERETEREREREREACGLQPAFMFSIVKGSPQKCVDGNHNNYRELVFRTASMSSTCSVL